MGERRKKAVALVLHKEASSPMAGKGAAERVRKPKVSEKASRVQASNRKKRKKRKGCTQKCTVSRSSALLGSA